VTKSFAIAYGFTFEDGAREEFDVRIDEETVAIIPDGDASAPDWTKLANDKCSHCPLNEADHPHCPLALNLANLVERLSQVLSYEKVHAVVTIDDKRIIKETSAQKAVSSLMGLIMATSGCPHTEWFKPMARFHTPFATIEETSYRAAAMYMLAQYYLTKRGRRADFSLKGLTRIYEDVAVVNKAMAERLRKASIEDASVNALVLLDLFTKVIPDSLADSLKSLEHLFTSYLDRAPHGLDSKVP
jgi:hypothetical protein